MKKPINPQPVGTSTSFLAPFEAGLVTWRPPVGVRKEEEMTEIEKRIKKFRNLRYNFGFVAQCTDGCCMETMVSIDNLKAEILWLKKNKPEYILWSDDRGGFAHTETWNAFADTLLKYLEN